MLTTKVEGVDLVAMGYTYNKRKVIYFTATAGAANTFDGDDPYMQLWVDEIGNICVRAVRRPTLASEYFSQSPGVDNHNQSRQHALALEVLLQSHKCCFRLLTAFMGIHMVDCCKLFLF
jgi:deoxyribodipyrimidine photolyase